MSDEPQSAPPVNDECPCSDGSCGVCHVCQKRKVDHGSGPFPCPAPAERIASAPAPAMNEEEFEREGAWLTDIAPGGDQSRGERFVAEARRARKSEEILKIVEPPVGSIVVPKAQWDATNTENAELKAALAGESRVKEHYLARAEKAEVERDDARNEVSVWHTEYDKLKVERDRLREALEEAASSLEALSTAGAHDSTIEDLIDVRGYAGSRAREARAALASSPGGTEEKTPETCIGCQHPYHVGSCKLAPGCDCFITPRPGSPFSARAGCK
jgi:hypothetical protein